MNRGNGGVNVLLVVAILLVIALFGIGYFKSDRVLWDTFGIKTLLRLPCGLTVNDPDATKDIKAVFPILVDGYANGCGWDVSSGNAGTVQVFDGKGLPVTLPTGMFVVRESTNAPFYFKTYLKLHTPPTTDKGNILFISTTGLIHSIPITF